MPIFPRYAGPPLLDQVCTVENLTLAWRRVRSNIQVARRRSSAGPDAVTLADFEADWVRQMTRLADELRNGTYRPLLPRRVYIPKASGGERAIAILAVRDRVAQRAVQQVLTPLFEPLFLDCSYGCRAALGVPDAVARVARYADQGLSWAVDADITSYFDTIDQRILLGLLRQRIEEPALLQLIARWLDAGVLAHDEVAPLDARTRSGSALLARSGQALRGLFDQGLHTFAAPAPFSLPDPADPYGAAAWEDGTGAGLPLTPGTLRGDSLANQLWTATMVARPALALGRQALPMLQRIGGPRLAMAGAAAAGALAVGELALRARDGRRRRGTPQGGALSPLLANIYLHPFDLALTSQGLRLVRFMDDFVVLCASQQEAAQALTLITRQLAVLRLTLNADKTSIVRYADGLEFLGQALAPRQTGPRLAAGVGSFAEAEQQLRAVGRRVQQGTNQARQRLRRKPTSNEGG